MRVTIHVSFEDSREAEIGYFGNAVVKENVGRFDVPVDDFLIVEHFEPLDDVFQEHNGFELV